MPECAITPADGDVAVPDASPASQPRGAGTAAKLQSAPRSGAGAGNLSVWGQEGAARVIYLIKTRLSLNSALSKHT